MKTLIGLPCMGMVHTDFLMSLINLKPCGETKIACSVNSLIYDSRNTFSADAINKGYDRLLFIDSDMTFKPDLLQRLSADMDQGYDYVTALCFSRKEPIRPTIYTRIAYDQTDEGIRAGAEPYRDYPRDSLFPIAGSGSAAVLISVDLLKRVWESGGPPFDPMTHLGEDLSFCLRASKLGAKMACDSSVKCGHIGLKVYDEAVYLGQNDRQSNPDMQNAANPGSQSNACPDKNNPECQSNPEQTDRPDRGGQS